MMDYGSKVKKDLYKLYIDGQFTESVHREVMDFINPATGEVFGQGSLGGKADAEKAIAAARRAFDSGPWGKMSGLERGKLLTKAGDILASRAEEFAVTETLDAGKQYMGALYYEVPQGVDAFHFYGHKARTLGGESSRLDGNYLNYVDWYPYGVVGEVLPWNGPLMMGCQKIGAILAAGNAVVVKPPSWASASLLLLAEVFDAAGFPPGAVNIISGSGAAVGETLVRSKLVDLVSLTGGTETGRRALRNCADTVKSLALELGGKSPNIIFDDADIPNAAKWAVHGFTLHSGQVCVSGTRVLVQRRIYEPFLAAMARVCESFRPGNGFDYEKGVNFSTLIHPDHAKVVWEYIRKGKAEGTRLICGGEPYTDPGLARGSFVPPTIFADVTPAMTIFREEIFGPVGCVTPFDTEDEAIALANDSDYGLAGGVFSADIKRAHRVAQSIRGGQIYINTYFSKGMIDSPGTGWKMSGVGVAGIHKYMISKTIFVDLNDHSEPPM
ncbi:MAG: aldehyde dehydrogenase family protein [Peptococcaceae bacterium]|jgi:acyl-CoA reductase-like NAD-dependent aldehyde dehydrogenase|nr:aldehyde dehydrogenase family protein [Peptococcaceae bacterium]